jgi:hypothetical protein
MPALMSLKGKGGVVEVGTDEGYVVLFGGSTWTFEPLGLDTDGAPHATSPIWLSSTTGVEVNHHPHLDKYIAYPGDEVTFPVGTTRVFCIAEEDGLVMNVTPGKNTLEPI